MQVFRGPGGSLARALARYETDHPEAWQGSVEVAESTVASLTPDALRALTTDDLSVLQRLRDRIARALEDRERLLGL